MHDHGDHSGDGKAERGVYRVVFEETEDAMFVLRVECDDGHRFVFERVNPAYERQTGLRESDLRGQTPPEGLGRQRWEPIAAHYRRCADRRDVVEYEESRDLPAGETYWQTQLVPVVEDDTVVAIVGTSRDITDHKERERALEDLTERFELAVEGANLGIWDWHAEEDRATYNDRWATMLGYDPDEIDDRHEAWRDRIHPEDQPVVDRAMEAHIAGETEYYDAEFRMQTADGDWKWIRGVGTVVARAADGSSARAVGVHIDIDDRRHAERGDSSEIRGPAVVLQYRLKADWPITYVSDNVADQFGYAPSAIRSDRTPFAELLHPDDADHVIEEVNTARAADTDQRTHEPFRVLTDSGDPRWVQAETWIVGTEEDSQRCVSYLTDITRRIRAEQRLEDQRDRLEVLTEVVRHDLRNHLQVIQGREQLLAEHVSDEGAFHLDEMRHSTTAAIEVMRTARDLTRTLTADREAADELAPATAIDDAVETARAQYGQAVVRTTGMNTDVTVNADQLLESLVYNLIQNAIVHNDAELPEVDVALVVDRSTDTVTIKVADNGPGVPDAQKTAIFDKGVRGPDSPGTGLGLYLVQTLAADYGGQVRIQENEPTGSVFLVDLPLAGAAAGGT